MSIQLPHDIIEPAPIGWWPLAPGWWLLIALTLLVLALVGRWWWQRRRALAPLQQALREHQQIAGQWQQHRDARASTAALSALLKRVARHYHPDEPVATLTGACWQDFLIRTGAGAFDADSAATLSRLYQNTNSADFAPPLSACERWLKAQRQMATRSRAAPLASVAPTDGAQRHV